MGTTHFLTGLCVLSLSVFQTGAAPNSWNPFPMPIPQSPLSCTSDSIGVPGIPISSQVVLPPGAQNYVVQVPNQCPGRQQSGLTVTVCNGGAASVRVVDLATALVDLGSVSLQPTPLTTTVQCGWAPNPYSPQPLIGGPGSLALVNGGVGGPLGRGLGGEHH